METYYDDTMARPKRSEAIENEVDNQTENESVAEEPIANEKKGGTWKKVSIGTATGILLGAGAIYAVDRIAGNNAEDSGDEAGASAGGSGEAEGAVIYSDAPVAEEVSDSMSFEDAFAAARDEVGPGGVFVWHGGVYGTYYADEWDSMSDADRTSFAESVHETPTPAPTPAAHAADSAAEHGTTTAHRQTEEDNNDDTAQHRRPIAVEEDGDVHVIGHQDMDGHDVAIIDADGDYEPDVAIIDIDDSGTVTDPDVVVFADGEYATVGEMAEQYASEQASEDNLDTDTTDGSTEQAYMENPDVAPDMPDYMDDASVML